MKTKKIFLIFLMVFMNVHIASISFGNTQFKETDNSFNSNLKEEMAFKVTPEVKEFLNLKDIYEQELTQIEVVGRAKSEKEEIRAKKIKKIISHLESILKTLQEEPINYPN